MPDRFILATLKTEAHTFHGLGRTELGARAAILAAMRVHQRDTHAFDAGGPKGEGDYVLERWVDEWYTIDYTAPLGAGEGARDGERLTDTAPRIHADSDVDEDLHTTAPRHPGRNHCDDPPRPDRSDL